LRVNWKIKLLLRFLVVFVFFVLSHFFDFGVFDVAVCFAQSALTQTTITADVGAGPTPFSGTTTAYTTTIPVAATTGLINSGVPLYIQSVMYIDQEAMAVISFNATTLQVVVQRGYQSTTVQPHKSGTMVLIGSPGAFNSQDPTVRSDAGTQNGACVASATAFTPYINVITGKQWLCSTITNTWVPGWNNTQAPYANTAAVASAAGTVTPSGPQFHITGALAITGFNIPVGFNGTAEGGGCFNVIPDAVFTWTAAGNIALAGSAVVNKLLTFCWDATNSKWIPSYIA
jgi:hypothetical protein